MQAGGFCPAIWRKTVSAQTVDRICGGVTAGGIGGRRIIAPMETRSRWLSRFAAGSVWRPLARAGHFHQIASVARPFARRTTRVGESVSHLGHATGGRPAKRLLPRLGLGVSDDTVLRQQKYRTQDTAEPPTVIGIDNWSWRKSQTYGAIIEDLERRAVIDVLEDHDVVICTD